MPAARPTRKGPRRRTTTIRRQRAAGYSLLIPAVVVYAVFVIWPIISTVMISLTKWNGLAKTRAWVGLDNYVRLAGDERFYNALVNNFAWVVGSWLAQGLGLALAALLAASWMKGRAFFRTVFFVPAIMSLVVVGIAWDQIYKPDGALNAALAAAGLDYLQTGWLSNQATAMPAVITTANWTYFGFAMVVFLGGMQSIDDQLYEAAALDGAGGLRQFWSITVPQLRPQITLLLVISFINTLKTFDLVYVITNGGPGRATEVVAYYIYSLAFVTRQVGYGAAASVALTVVILAITVAFIRLQERDA